MKMRCVALLLLSLAPICSAGDTIPSLAFSAGFTSDMVLQRAPAKAAVYGLVQASAGAKVEVTVSGPESYTVQATLDYSAGVGSFCSARCVEMGDGCRGSISACLRPSCDMGCRVGRYSKTAAECKAMCKSKKWPPGLVSDDGTSCDSSPVTGGCPEPGFCEMGCDWSKNLTAPMAWKAFLKPTTAGEGYTITAKCTGCEGDGNQRILERVAFGDVWFCRSVLGY
jgi:hypothetical protein